MSKLAIIGTIEVAPGKRDQGQSGTLPVHSR